MAIAGKCHVTVNTPLGRQERDLELTVNGDTVTGDFSNSAEKNAVKDGKPDGDSITFKTVLSTPMGAMDADGKASITGDTITGVLTIPFGPLPFMGNRI